MNEKSKIRISDDKERQAIEELSRDLKSNKFVKGEMQFTDVTNRDYFLKAHGNHIRFCTTWNKFLLWNGTCWQTDTRAGVESLCVGFVHKMYRGMRVINEWIMRIISLQLILKGI